MRKIKIYDTTLRDGCQAEDISFSADDKMKIARKLDELGVHYVEGGWPGASPRDDTFFQGMRRKPPGFSRIVAFGSTHRPGLTPGRDPLLKNLVDSGAQVAAIVGKTWDLHVREALGIGLERNLELIYGTLRYLKSKFEEVIFDAEHFFDGYRRNSAYALKALKAAVDAGADWIVLCDTNGGSLPFQIEEIIRETQKVISSPLGIHTHNDGDLAVASALAAVNLGVNMVQGTINGFGERCGNANLCSIIPNLRFKMNLECIPQRKLSRLTEISRYVNELANVKHDTHEPYVGNSAFAHKGGIHVSAIRKNPETYEHIRPELVGNRRRVLISDQAGRSNILYKAAEYGMELESSDPAVRKILTKLKDLENKGFQFEGAEGSFELLMKKAKKKKKKFFDLKGFRVIVEKRKEGEEPISEATVKLYVGDRLEVTAAEGNGPVAALDGAVRKALIKFYPSLKEVKLHDFKVRILDEKNGTGASPRVLIESGDGTGKWGTVGVSPNIIEASWQALIDSLEFKLHKDKIKPPKATRRKRGKDADTGKSR